MMVYGLAVMMGSFSMISQLDSYKSPLREAILSEDVLVL